MIKYLKGDLVKAFDSSEINVLVHGCNCFNHMGAGIAKQIKAVFPEAFKADEHLPASPEEKLGNMSIAEIDPGRWIINAYTQFSHGRGKVHADYNAIKKALTNIKNFVDPAYSIGMPKIGEGLAGGDWNIIESIINDVFNDRTVYVYVLE